MTKGTVILVLGPSGRTIADDIAGVLDGAEVHGPAGRIETADVLFDELGPHLAVLFSAGRPVVGVCAAAILIRLLAPHLTDKRGEPPVVAIAEDGSAAVPLLGGHNGGNLLAKTIARKLGIAPAITTAGDVRFGVALDSPPEGWTLANRADAKPVMAALLAGKPATIDTDLTWLDEAPIQRAEDAAIRLTATTRRESGSAEHLVYYPRRLVVGVGSDRGCPPEEAVRLAMDTFDAANLAPEAVAAVVSIDRKADEPAVHAVAEALGVEARFLSTDDIASVADRIPNPSAVVMREVGVPGVAEGAALFAAGDGGRLVAEKRKSSRATCAIAEATQLIEPSAIGQARGRISVVGIGPGTTDWRSPEATRLLTAATDWVGYGLYLDLAEDLAADKVQHRFPLGAEEDRVRFALKLAGRGKDVALLCSGDAGIYAMAALVFEVLEEAVGLVDAEQRVEVVIAPGISAVQAAAARAGAPIGHDFCLISLSDLMTPWSVIERRIEAAAEGDFVTAFYNPRSERRRNQLDRAMAILSRSRPASTPVIVASNLGRAEEALQVVTLQDFDADTVDMLSLVLVGSSETRAYEAGDGRTRVYTPRGYGEKRRAAE